MNKYKKMFKNLILKVAIPGIIAGLILLFIFGGGVKRNVGLTAICHNGTGLSDVYICIPENYTDGESISLEGYEICYEGGVNVLVIDCDVAPLKVEIVKKIYKECEICDGGYIR